MDGVLVLVLILLIIYFIPTMVALSRGHKNCLAIFCLNLFLGWSFVGWVLALVWSCTNA